MHCKWTIQGVSDPHSFDPTQTDSFLLSIQATIGPISAGMRGMEPAVESMHVYNPRCIRRDLNAKVSAKFFNTANLLNLTIGDASKTIELFQNEFNGRPQDDGFLGLREYPDSSLKASS